MKKILILGASLVSLVTLSGCSSYSDWNDWNRDCIEAGGVVSITHRDFWADRYECVIDKKIVTLPGWEGY
jgi:hypothetical protein